MEFTVKYLTVGGNTRSITIEAEDENEARHILYMADMGTWDEEVNTIIGVEEKLWN